MWKRAKAKYSSLSSLFYCNKDAVILILYSRREYIHRYMHNRMNISKPRSRFRNLAACVSLEHLRYPLIKMTPLIKQYSEKTLYFKLQCLWCLPIHSIASFHKQAREAQPRYNHWEMEGTILWNNSKSYQQFAIKLRVPQLRSCRANH